MGEKLGVATSCVATLYYREFLKNLHASFVPYLYQALI